MTILIADDNAINLKLLKAILQAAYYQVIAAEDGLEAFELLQCHKVDGIISDILMPRMDGYRLCQEVRQAEPTRNLPFIFYTATYTSTSDEGLARRLGADDFLRKPAPADQILASLKHVLSHPRIAPPSSTLEETSTVIREYSDALVRKLEHKNAELERAHEMIVQTNADLERRVRERTAQLEAANAELEAFSYSAAHDLRTPLRAINGFCQLLEQDLAPHLTTDSTHLLTRIKASALKMNTLIDELLRFSQVSRCEIQHHRIDLSHLVRMIFDENCQLYPQPPTQIVVEPGFTIEGDLALTRIAFENLIQNAFKYSARKPQRQIEFGVHSEDPTVCYIRDDGAGFDMAYAKSLFGAFQRMHTQRDFPGTGLGLAIVHRIITRHGGRIWAQSAPDEGATFFMKWPRALEN